jgi:hypothetical protein
MPDAVDRLFGAAEVRDVLVSAARAADGLDRERLTSSFWPDATVRYGTMPEWTREALVDAWSAAAQRCAATQHHLFNDSLDVDGDAAYVETYYIAVFVPTGSAGRESLLPFCGGVEPGRVGFQGGRYVDRLERREGRWRIASRQVCGDWFATADATETTARRGDGPTSQAGPVPGAERARLADLLQREAVRDTVQRFARGLDRVDLDLLASAFVSLDGERELVESLLSERDSRPVQCHYVTNLRVSLGTGSAQAEASFIAAHCEARGAPRPVHLLGGRYRFDLVQTGDGWRIATWTSHAEWRATADGRHIEAFHRATGDKSRRNRDDASYQPLVRAATCRTIGELIDREGVRDALARYARGVDRLDRQLIESAFVDVAPQFVDYMFAQAQVRPIQDHCWTNLRVELTGDGAAYIEAYYISVHGYVDGATTGFIDGTTSAEDVNLVAGRYVRWFEKVDGRWGLRNLSTAATYPPPNGGLGDWHAVLDGSGLAEYLAATGNASRRRGGDDPSYRRN